VMRMRCATGPPRPGTTWQWASECRAAARVRVGGGAAGVWHGAQAGGLDTRCSASRACQLCC
jgi:hypothetical protein